MIPSLQRALSPVGQKLQAGVATVADAQQASERWGRAAFRSEVEVWVLDCAAGREMDLPSALVNRPTAVLAYAAAHFRPRSLSSDQCAIVVVAASSSYNVVQRPPAPM
ncbi:MAG TPA: hypothetical protein VHJ20_10020 [Polyangia bacterium]|nr:hypothetical protein [Polyangia bacterium]